jgi:hypothetical protein
MWFYMLNDKPDGYPIPARNPTGTSTGMNFYPRVRVQISTHNLFADRQVIALPNPTPTCCHPEYGPSDSTLTRPTYSSVM